MKSDGAEQDSEDDFVSSRKKTKKPRLSQRAGTGTVGGKKKTVRYALYGHSLVRLRELNIDVEGYR